MPPYKGDPQDVRDWSNKVMEVFFDMAASERDPVCGMDVDSGDAAGQSNYEGQTYYFCSQQCKRQFDEDPQKFVQESGRRAGGGV